MKALKIIMSCITAFLFVTPTLANNYAVEGFGLGAESYPNENSVHGFEFFSDVDIRITELGLLDFNDDGLFLDHDIGIFNTEGTLLSSGTINSGTGNLLDNHFRYVDITDVVLTADRRYSIAYFTGNYDDFHATDAMWSWDGMEVTTASNITITDYKWDSSSSLMDPGNIVTSRERVNANFKFEVIPEPASVALIGLVSGGIYFTRRFFIA